MTKPKLRQREYEAEADYISEEYRSIRYELTDIADIVQRCLARLRDLRDAGLEGLNMLREAEAIPRPPKDPRRDPSQQDELEDDPGD